jgi:DNA-binding MurR/RpiR family transcriptional regulator
VLEQARAAGATTIGITNERGSSMTRLADRAGEETSLSA